ncbi:DJ-1/PfpI family protein [Kitasatospora aureofaciens]|uniref:Glutamine amidotransferase n=1 Tax=Kitasatospora aureofaciens TaxID=1894 RepID=A0A1E7NC04_KITAU|nr:DJ-1/PfpI family protein [Kitasatospora aureofaciens]OEV38215.1 glutamine amidotransferase [Kitasatospora aureofaciens]QEV01527.1 DJ-1/PfpI family protein [Streptomyces viridifaciens]UKZ07934.1 DJ-1/PfpI family protein [Streptomyces viridifaciens]GGU98104.1 glutamine amidotransferase [Kitasatospora aureofaciens]
MRIAVLLYPDFTTLDAVGPYEVLSRIPGAEVVFTAAGRGPVRNDLTSLAITADAALDEVDSADLLLVPGGPGTEAQLTDEAVLDWVRRIDATTTWTTSVCSGSLLLGAAGLLRGRRATSHWGVLDQLPRFGAEPTGSERIVVDGKYATAAGVSAGIDLALTLTGLIAGDETAQAIQLLIEYDPQPPYAAGSLAKASPEVVAGAHRLLQG